ncbi:hypothetical protein ACM66B_006999 [Microbotryomycetes sp. NB124-2]
MLNTTQIPALHKTERDCDLESGNSQTNSNAGAPLGRQISVQLSNEQYERLFLQTGGQGGKGDLSKRLGNPTPLGVASFLLCFTPFACNLMGWGNTTAGAAAVTIGAFYFIGGIGSILAGIMEWVLGNTFPATVFSTFGGFWLAFGFLLDPTKTIAETLGAASVDYNAGLAIYLVWWGLLILIYLVASLRTNVVFASVFLFLDACLWTLVTAYYKIAAGNMASVPSLMKAAGALAFLTCVSGWYLLLVLVLGSTGFPLALPVGDLSGFLTRKPKQL